MAAKEFTRKQRKSMIKLKKYTGSASKKTKKDSNKFKGWYLGHQKNVIM
jgi:hypothetical protein